MRKFEGTYICKKTHDLKPIGANWEYIENPSSMSIKFPVSEEDMKAFLFGKDPEVSEEDKAALGERRDPPIAFYCRHCNTNHRVPLSMIPVEELKETETQGCEHGNDAHE